MKTTLLSFVIPCYGSEHTIEKVIDEIIETVAQRPEFDYEVIAVDDCSPDALLPKLRSIAAANPKVKVLSFSRNMGKHAAVLAGYKVARGKYVIDLDDDFQSPLPELWNLLAPVLEDRCDYATAKYYVKRQSLFKRFGSNVNLWMSSFMLGKPTDLRFENFSAMKRFVPKEMIRYRHPFPYLEGLVLRVTRRITTVEMDQRERADDPAAGGFTFRKSLSLWLNGFTAFSVTPLRFASLLGLLVSFCGFGFSIFIVVQKLLYPNISEGFSSIMATILIMNGIIMGLLGLIGEYLGRIYICINDAPQYVIKESFNLSSRQEDEVEGEL